MTTITDRITGLNSGLAVKAPVKVATTANITLNGLQTIDGVTVVEGDRVLVKNQTTGSENGIYKATTSDWQRAKDFDGIGDAVQGTLIPVAQGTVSAGVIYEVTTETFTIGTTALVFSATADTSIGSHVAEIQIVADNIADVNAVGSNIADVTAVAANEANINTVVANIVDIQNAEENADIAATAAITATAQAAKLTGTSTTSIAIGTGSKVFTTQADKDFNGNNVRVFSDADPTNYMDGLASYSGTTLTVTVTAIGGSGTFTDWTIRVNGARGATGTAGSITDGDKGDITVSDSGATWTADATLISGKTEDTIASTDNILIERSGTLYRDTVQGVVDVTKDYLFDQSSATLDGTEKVSAEQSGTAITVTTQDIADLAGGGGISVTSQTLQATTITTDGSHPTILKNIIDGKLLQVRRAASTNYPLLLSVLTVATDGTVSFGSETSYAESTDKLTLRYSNRSLSDLVKLSATKFLMMFTNETDFSLNVALLTVDTDANTVTVNNSYIILDETDAAGFMAQGAKILGIDGTTAVIVYQSGAASSSTTKGRVITLDSATTLAVGAEQTILNNSNYNGQLINGIASPYANHFVVTGFNTDAAKISSVAFTRSGDTLTLKATNPVTTLAGTTLSSQTHYLFSYAKDRVLGNIFVNTVSTAIASTPDIPQGMGVCIENNYNVDSTSVGTLLTPVDGSAIINRFPATPGGGYYIPYVENDNFIIFGYYDSAVEKLFIKNKRGGTIQSVMLESLQIGVNNAYQLKNSIAKVRDGQYMVLFSLPTTYYLHYLPVLIEGVD